MVYPPSEDSYLLADEVKKYITDSKNKTIKILDMGSGSGIQAISAIKAGIPKKYILCADIDEEAIEAIKKQKLRVILSNLFNKITDNFNLIIFNAPYLPEDKYDKELDTTAGKTGNEIIIKFLKQAKSHLSKDGAILLLFSSLSKPKEILNEAKKLGYKSQELAKKNVGMMETLWVYEFY
jgi:release factor glutamine methyltransferase